MRRDDKLVVCEGNCQWHYNNGTGVWDADGGNCTPVEKCGCPVDPEGDPGDPVCLIAIIILPCQLKKKFGPKSKRRGGSRKRARSRP